MYAPLPGIDIYFEDHGTGTPLVLLHGGMLTLDLSFGALMPRLTRAPARHPDRAPGPRSHRRRRP